jgi:DNA-binding LacI/PurR family transcriptional regulator
MVTQHLIASGHQKIGFVAGPNRSRSAIYRGAGYRRALREAGLPHVPAWEQACLPVVDDSKRAVTQLLTAHPELTALFCHNDLVAIGALQACAALGRQVPADTAVAGFDDIMLASLVTPPLTTCRAPQYELGQRAAQYLLKRVNELVEDNARIVFETELIVRASAP